MLEIYNIKDKQKYLKEVAELTQKEWGSKCKIESEFLEKINKKIDKIKDNFDNPLYCKLILIKNSTLIGFISIFPSDCDERKDLSPWYATMFVKEEFRGNNYSKLLNDAILKEAKNRDFNRIYLKTTLDNYYEKFGAKFLEILDNGEKIYYFNL